MGLIQQENSAGPSRLTAIVDEEASSSFIIMDDCKSGAGDRSQDASSLLNAAAIFDLSSSPSSYSALEDMMIDHIARHAALENFESSSQTAVKTAGRLGPDQVSIDKSSARGQLTYSHGEMCMEASGAFSSARANVCVFGGKWQYECLITCAWTAGIQQIGWAPLSCPFTAEEGVGDAPDSYAYDGKRVKKWNVRSQNYGEAWTTGDVIGACIDLKGDQGEISFYRNGRPLGVAFKGIKSISAGLAYFPTISLSHAEKCELNFGAYPFRYPVDGFQPLQSSPPPPILYQAEYLLGCLERLAKKCGNVHTWGQEDSPFALPSDLPVPDYGDKEDLPWEDACIMAGIVGKHLHPLLFPTLPPSASQTSSPSSSTRPDLDPNSAAAMARDMVSEYLLSGTLVHTFLTLSAKDGPVVTRAAMRLLMASMHPSNFNLMIHKMMEALSLKCVSSPILPLDLNPNSPSLPTELSGSNKYLELIACLTLGVREARQALISYRGLYQVVEQIMARKSPTSEDLKALLPFVAWRGQAGPENPPAIPGQDKEAEAEAMMTAHVTGYAIIKGCIEDYQYKILVGLFLGNDGEWRGGENPLVAFLKYLIQKNRGSTRDMQPSGLSDPNVLLSTWFALLRLLAGSRVGGSQEFPAGDLLVQSFKRGSMDPSNDLARLGGIVSYLTRELPCSPLELKPLKVHHIPEPIARFSPVSSAAYQTRSRALPLSTHVSMSDLIPAAEYGKESSWMVDEATKRLSSHDATELLHLSIVIYSFRGSGVVKQLGQCHQSLISNQSAIERVEAQLNANASPPTYLIETRNFLRNEIETNVRCLRLLESTLYGGWKMEALLWLSSWISSSFLPPSDHSRVKSKGEGEVEVDSPLPSLLAYVPTCYVDLVLDILSAYKSCLTSSPAIPSSSHTASSSSSSAVMNSSIAKPTPPRPHELLPHGLDLILHFLSQMIDDPRIRNPDACENLLNGALGVVDSRELSDALETLPGVPRLLVRAACVAFCGKNWQLASNVLAATVKRRTDDEQKQGGGEQRSARLEKCRLELEGCVRPDSTVVSTEAASSPKAFKSKTIVQKLFDQLNWAVTEAATSISLLHDARKTLIEPLLASEPAVASESAVAADAPGASTAGGEQATSSAGEAMAPSGSAEGGGGGEEEEGPPPMAPNSESPSPAPAPSNPPNPPNPPNPNQRAVGSRPQVDESQVVRKIVSMLETAKTLLRLLEFIAVRSPATFLSPSCALNLTRLMELVPFVLGHFCMGPDAKCLNQLLMASRALQQQQQQQGTTGARLASRRGHESGLGALGGVLPQAISRANERVMVVHVDRPLHDKISKADLLSPLATCLVALWRADEANDRAEGWRGGSGGGREGGLGSGSGSGEQRTQGEQEEISPVGEMDLDPEGEGEEGEGEDNWPHQWDMRQPFIEMLAGVVDERVMGDLDYLVDFLQWPKDPSEAEGERGEGLPPLAAFVALREALVRVKGQSLSPFPPSPLTRNNPGPFSNPLDIQGASSPGRRADSNAPSPGHRNSPFPLQPSPIAEVPDEFLDPITASIMMDPVILPDSQVTVDRSTIERQISIQGTDPFSRRELTLDMVKPNIELRAKIRAYLSEQRPLGLGGGGTPKSAGKKGGFTSSANTGSFHSSPNASTTANP